MTSTLRLFIGNCTIRAGTGNSSVDAWGIEVTVDGGDSNQSLCVGPSLVVNNTLVMADSVCSPQNEQKMTLAACESRRGATLDPGRFDMASASDLVPDPGWGTFQKPPTGRAIKGLLRLRESDVVSLVMGLIENGQNHALSHFGLGPASSILRSLKDSGRIARMMFGLRVGSTSIDHSKPGALVLGGWDSLAVGGPWYNYPMNYNKTVGDRVCSLQLNILDWNVTTPGRPDYQINFASHPLPACLEPYDVLFRVPPNTIKLYIEAFRNLTGYQPEPLSAQDIKEVNQTMYVQEPGLTYPAQNETASFKGSFVIRLQGDLIVNIPNHEIHRVLRGLASDGRRVLDPRYTETQIFHEPAPAGAAVLPAIFLSAVSSYPACIPRVAD